MAREAKIGLVVIGILLAVFSGLLIKRLARPTKVPTSAVAVNKTGETSPRQSPKPSPPTMVTPKPEMSKPPELMANDNQPGQAPKASDWTTRSRREPSSTLRLEDPVTSRSSANASLMATAGDRYPAATEIAPSPRPTAQLHRSGYGAAGNETSPSPAPSYGRYSTPPATVTPAASPTTPSPSAALSTPPTNPLRAETPHVGAVGSRYPMPSSTTVDLSRPATQTGTPEPASSRSTPSYTPTAVYSGPGYTQPSATNPPAASPSAISPPMTSPRTMPAAVERGMHSPSPSTSYDRGRPAATAATPISNPYENNPFSRSYPTTTPVAMPSPPAVSGTRLNRDGEEYTVQPNDSFWIICEKLYGNGAYFKALYEHNRKRHKQADELTVGQKLLAPDEAVLRRMYPDLCPKPRVAVASTQQRLASASSRLNGGGRVYTVVEGDTLFEIARYELGKPSRWGEIYDLNRDILGSDFDYLRPGTELILPDDSGKRDTITRQPGEFMPRR